MLNLSGKYRIRRANNSDSDKIKGLIFGILDEYGLNPDPVSTDKDLDDIGKEYLNNNGIFDVILDENNKIIATTGIYRIDDDVCELRKMYLSKKYRGKGIGKFLLEHSLGCAKALGYKKVILETASVLKEAIALYKSYGFKELRSGHLSSRCDQRYYLDL